MASESKPSNSENLKEGLSIYTKNWKWFAVSVFAAFLIAFVILRYSVPKYGAEIKIQILEDKTAGSELDLFSDLELFTGGKNKVEDEIQIINSKSNFNEVVKRLGLNKKVILLGNIRNSEIYSNPPINLNIIAEDSTIANAYLEFYVTVSSNTTFGYSLEENSPVKVYAFGNTISTPIGDVIITPNTIDFDRYRDKKLKVIVTPISWVSQVYREKMVITNPGEFSNILRLYLEDPIPQKGRDILNSLIRVYNQNEIEDKQRIADRTATFINERLADISRNLTNVDETAEEFKTERGVTDIASEANINLNVGVANQQELANVRTQLNIASSMQDIVTQQDGYEILPVNVGLSDQSITSATARYNDLVLERNRLLKSSNEKNPVIVNLDQQIESLKESMMSSLSSTVNNLGMQVNTLSGQQAIFNSKIYSAPGKERALRDITRKQETTESLYLYLLQKREESQIAAASSSPKCKIIDSAFNVSALPVSPKKPIVYLTAVILGLLLPFSVIYAKDVLDTKIHNMQSLENITKDIPVLGELPSIGRNETKLLVQEDRTILAESLRIIRTNLDYLLNVRTNDLNKGNRIFITSSVPGEGKTFLSVNLALILASSNKKVLLIGADIRNPKLYSFFASSNIDRLPSKNRRSEIGITEFLYDDKFELKDITNSLLVNHHTIDVIYSGRIPPNPSELLMSDRLHQLFYEASEMYDYVIVDTAPLMVVTDTLLITKYADQILYVTRAGFTDEKAINYPIKLQKEGKLSGLSFIVNDVKSTDLGYGGKYGYGYGKTTKKWWKLF